MEIPNPLKSKIIDFKALNLIFPPEQLQCMIISDWEDSDHEKVGVLNLTKKTFGDSEVSIPSYYDWLYRKNPNGKPIIVLAKDDSKNNIIIGIEPIIPTKLIVEKKITRSYLSCNSAVDPDYRGRGIFSKLVGSVLEKSSKNDAFCIYGVPNENSFGIFTNHGFIELAPLPLLIRPLKLSNYFSGVLRSIWGPFDKFFMVKSKTIAGVEIFNGNYDDYFDILMDKVLNRVSVIQSRDKEFLHWRYWDHPTRKYKTFVLKEDSTLRGYVVTRIATINGKNVGVIVDFLIDDEITNQEKLKDLVLAVLADFWQNDISIAIATCGNNLSESKVLKKVGFFTLPGFLKPEKLHFIVALIDSKDPNLKTLKNIGNWFLSFGDYDVF